MDNEDYLPSKEEIFKLLIKYQKDKEGFINEYVMNYRKSSEFYDHVNADILANLFWIGCERKIKREKMKKLMR